jgi:hypothetical protein
LLLACVDAIIAAQNAADSFGVGSCYIGDIREQRELFASRGSGLDTDIAPFGKRKYMSDFSYEMRRSVAEYLKEFGEKGQ